MTTDAGAPDTAWQPFLVAVAEWMTDRRPSTDLPEAAVQVLVAGGESPTLGALAGMTDATWSEIEPVVRQVLTETGRSITHAEAEHLVLEGWLRQVAAGTVAPVWEFHLSEMLRDAGGVYSWFAFVLYDFEFIEATGNAEWLGPLLEDARTEAERVLAMTREQRLAQTIEPHAKHPFLQS